MRNSQNKYIWGPKRAQNATNNWGSFAQIAAQKSNQTAAQKNKILEGGYAMRKKQLLIIWGPKFAQKQNPCAET